MKNWVKFYPPKKFVDENGNVSYGARGYHSKILDDFIKMRRRRQLRKKRDSHKIKRLK
jgi:hypothetical protein